MGRVPPNSQLTWVEVKDFTPGLWQTGDWLTPSSGSQEMVDCYPQQGGGIRAFFKPSTLATTGIGAGERVIGFYGYSTAHRTLPTTGTDFYLVTHKTGDLKSRLYRWDQTDATQTQWTMIKLFAAGGDSPHSSDIMAYFLSAGTVRIIVRIGDTSTDTGLWAANQSDVTGVQSFAKIATTTGGPITVHQNRLIEGRGSVVWFTNPGDETFAVSNFVNIEPQRNWANIRFMIPNAPGDLIVAKEGAAWSAVQGDLTSPTVRTYSDAHTPGQRSQMPADTGAGIAFIEPSGGIYVTDTGFSFQRLDAQLYPVQPPGDANVAVTMGYNAFYHHWLFTPAGRIRDFETKSWLRSSWISGNTPAYIQWVDRNAATYAITMGTSPAIYKYLMDDGVSPRANSYTWKTSPLRDTSGRSVKIREVQLVADSYVNTTSVTVTVNGTARTVTAIPVGRQFMTFLFNETAEVLDVQVDTNSGDTSHEAPSIEVARIGYMTRHLQS